MNAPSTRRTIAELTAAAAAGERLDPTEVAGIVERYHSGEITDAQAAAWLTTVHMGGLDHEQLVAMCNAMVASGDRLRWDVDSPVVDKHSTGGVGDKLSLILAPLLAAAGYAVPMLSGRGLGHTGGTLDKLEAIPGYTAVLAPAQLQRILQRTGCFIAGAGDRIAPADAKLYALRDHTGTVASTPLIATSILSKKIAGGADTLVIDVRVGTGAFYRLEPAAWDLCHTMSALAHRAGIAFDCALSSHNAPLGNTAGNACEVEEALEVLAGGGPSVVRNHTVALASRIAGLADGGAGWVDTATFEGLLDSGHALERFWQMIAAQGGNPEAPLPRPAHRVDVRARRSGYVQLDALAVGRAAWAAGAGRTRPGAPVDPAAGIRIHAPHGSNVDEGELICVVEGNEFNAVLAAARTLADTVTYLSYEPPSDVGAGAPVWRSKQ